jgi:hypothetical protein
MFNIDTDVEHRSEKTGIYKFIQKHQSSMDKQNEKMNEEGRTPQEHLQCKLEA